MAIINPKWVVDLVMNLLWDVESGGQLSSSQHLQAVPREVQDIAYAVMAYHGQLQAARNALAAAQAEAPAQTGVDTAAAEPVTQVLPLPQAPFAAAAGAEQSVPANSAGR
jgi:hypothetical protein